MIRICHLSSAHRGLDVRIFLKECVSLAAAGYETHLVIAANEKEVSEAESMGIKIHSLKISEYRFSRFIIQAWRTYKIAKKINAEIYHFHDSELIPFCILLSISGKKVIYDVHEDLPIDILTKDWINPYIRKFVSLAMRGIEFFGAKFFFSVVAATPFIAKRFSKITKHVVAINNYPKLSEFDEQYFLGDKLPEVCYIGGISRIRGIQELVLAMSKTQSGAKLNLCGSFNEPDVEYYCKALPGWKSISELGFVDRIRIREVLHRSVAGLVTLHPVINYLDALPVKMFEYMAAGIPVISSDFPLWREIIIDNECGICVDPTNPSAIAEAIDYFVNNPDVARSMGAKGRSAVLKKYNWHEEEKKLIQMYSDILNFI